MTQQAAPALSVMQTHTQEKGSVNISATKHFKIFFFFLRIGEKKTYSKRQITDYAFHASYKILVLSFSLYLHYILHMMFCTVKVQSTPHS